MFTFRALGCHTHPLTHPNRFLEKVGYYWGMQAHYVSYGDNNVEHQSNPLTRGQRYQRTVLEPVAVFRRPLSPLAVSCILRGKTATSSYSRLDPGSSYSRPTRWARCVWQRRQSPRECCYFAPRAMSSPSRRRHHDRDPPSHCRNLGLRRYAR